MLNIYKYKTSAYTINEIENQEIKYETDGWKLLSYLILKRN